jgi:hypothetical protein
MWNNSNTEQVLNYALRQKRSAVLHQMQLAGIDTADWKRVDAFCQSGRIAGKRFCQLTEEELDAVLVKVRLIRRKAERKLADGTTPKTK